MRGDDKPSLIHLANYLECEELSGTGLRSHKRLDADTTRAAPFSSEALPISDPRRKTRLLPRRYVSGEFRGRFAARRLIRMRRGFGVSPFAALRGPPTKSLQSNGIA